MKSDNSLNTTDYHEQFLPSNWNHRCNKGTNIAYIETHAHRYDLWTSDFHVWLNVSALGKYIIYRWYYPNPSRGDLYYIIDL